MSQVKVLIVDDSALVRQMLEEMLGSDPQITVVGTAEDPLDARSKIKLLRPNVLTLDIEMPKMDGVTFLKNLMRLHPLPVVMISTLTEKGADVTFEALDVGAVDFVTKPKINLAHSFEDYALEICNKVKAASRVSNFALEQYYARYAANLIAKPKVLSMIESPRVARSKAVTSKVVKKYSVDDVLQKSKFNHGFTTIADKIIALGASTGGTEAIKEVLMRLPASTPAIVITQHIPAAFSLPFAKRMNSVSEMSVCQAKDGQKILSGHVYIAPGDKHLLVEKKAGGYICRLNDGPAVNRHKPSVDVMFRSVSQNVGSNSIGIILTGMGNDGAVGMKELQTIGAPTIAQDEKTSVVWGMPGEAVKLNAADNILPLSQVAKKILSYV